MKVTGTLSKMEITLTYTEIEKMWEFLSEYHDVIGHTRFSEELLEKIDDYLKN